MSSLGRRQSSQKTFDQSQHFKPAEIGPATIFKNKASGVKGRKSHGQVAAFGGAKPTSFKDKNTVKRITSTGDEDEDLQKLRE